ncbi:hypothetical protein EI94DRAFT_1814071 [Lactarius quietus]|nr:hypothetical protein EI94DRAFT_1814071 [Lactarius quietus]
MTNAAVAHPSTSYGTGLITGWENITNWADFVANADVPYMYAPNARGVGTSTASTPVSSSEFITSGSTSCTNSPRYAVFQSGLKRDDENDTFLYQTEVANHGWTQLKRKREVTPTPSEMPAAKTACQMLSALPAGAEVRNRCRIYFIPTYVRWIAMQDNPWAIPDQIAILALQAIWDALYPNVTHTVIVNDGVFQRANQRLCEWRNAFRSTTDAIIQNFFECVNNGDLFKPPNACKVLQSTYYEVDD